MKIKSIEVYYDTAMIPNSNDGQNIKAALAFRNAAMEHVENALLAADAGEWAGAEIGGGEVNFGFNVYDFDAAEALIRKAVTGTQFEGIRNIARREFDTDTVEDMEMGQLNIKPMSMFELIGALVLRRMPKRFRNLT